MDGVVVVNKAKEWTSHDVVAKMRRLAGTKRIGHLGTLDPMATGVLPLVVGRATRLAQFFTLNDKVYDATVRFGFSTNSYDADGEATSPEIAPDFSRDCLEAWLAEQTGDIFQVPPAVSAKKIDGVPAYKLARKNQPVEMKPVAVTVHSIDVLEFALPRVRMRVHSSAGTYVRSIAHDLGARAGCGAHLSALVRERSGEFTLAQARSLEELAGEGAIAAALLPLERLLPEMPREFVDAATETQIRHGRDFRASPFRTNQNAQYVKAVSPEGNLIAIGEARLPGLYHPVLVL